jgi:hypothetical protein
VIVTHVVRDPLPISKAELTPRVNHEPNLDVITHLLAGGVAMGTFTAVVAIGVILVPAISWAQPPLTARFAKEISVSVGMGHVFVYEGDTLGNRLNIGGSLAIVHRSGVGVEFEVNRTLGFSPELARCAIEGTTCFGPARTGIWPPTIASLNFQYRFKARRVQPYVTAGLGVMWVRYPQTEADVTEIGFGPDLGAGLRLSISRALSLSPEIRWLDAPWRSGANLAVTRVVVRTAYSW